MPQRRVTIRSANGLHARPASAFAQAASATRHRVQIGRIGDEPVLASSVLMVMGLALQDGEEVVLSADDAAAEPALTELAALLSTLEDAK
ncbi:MAG TPA: HPr family phosphocarrier protein [Cellulomonas sp.]